MPNLSVLGKFTGVNNQLSPEDMGKADLATPLTSKH